MKLSLPKVIAHRGASCYAPENTQTAFKKAAEMGATWVEFDVKLTSDDQLIVFHDEELNRTTDGEGLVSDHRLATIKTLDAGSWFGNEFIGEEVPTFMEVIDVLSEWGLNANVEIKPNPGQEKKTAISALQLVEKNWPKHLSPPLISSFSRDSLITVRTLSEDALLGLLLDTWSKDFVAFARRLNCVSIHVAKEILTQEKAEFIKQNGFYLLVYTVDDASRAEEFFGWGVDSVFSNIPDLLTQVLC
ncbi:MAG: glycerophosphodiester phosphodiesterase [Gammaproteobacteria bacterium]|nr:glycerophosphodiester phosphodiesterase [Gammaproteobacteria bacterium]